MVRKRGGRVSVGVVLGGLITSACAVTQVDVDVYKGPLANHDDVQVEQLAIMAAAAKPVLIQLRNLADRQGAKLVGPLAKNFVCNWPTDEDRNALLAELPIEISETININNNTHDIFTAEFINNILSLYIDKDKIYDRKYTWGYSTDGAIREIRFETNVQRLYNKIDQEKRDEISRLDFSECKEGAFNVARVDKGLNSLAKEYLETANRDPREYKNSENSISKKRTLRFYLARSMIGFAQRILFIANNEQLLKSENDSPDHKNSAGVAYDQFQPRLFDKLQPLDAKRAVLQTVGNAILTQVDEMHQREAFTSKADGKGGAERQVISDTFSSSGDEYVTDLGKAFEALANAAEDGSDEKASWTMAFQALGAFRKDRAAELKIRSPNWTYGEIKRIHKLAATSGSSSTEEKAAAAALNKAMATVPAPPNWEPGAKMFDGATPFDKRVDALEALQAVMRQRHIKAVADFGAGSVQAQRAKEALKAISDHRSGMAYLRPTAAYLRSVFAATDLQDNTSTGWRNLLAQQGYRISGAGELVENPIRSTREILATLDKQYWQNINRVRVSGAGDTNYVLAKDDIGNWYVKGYSSNPREIIESATGLAKFALGPSLGGANLLANRGATGGATSTVGGGDTGVASGGEAEDATIAGDAASGGTDGTGSVSATGATRSAVERVFDRHQESYLESSRTELGELVAKLDADDGVSRTLKTAITRLDADAVDDRSDALEDIVDDAQTNHLDPVIAANPSDGIASEDNPGVKQQGVLRALLGYADAVNTGLRSVDIAREERAAEKDAADDVKKAEEELSKAQRDLAEKDRALERLEDDEMRLTLKIDEEQGRVDKQAAAIERKQQADNPATVTPQEEVALRLSRERLAELQAERKPITDKVGDARSEKNDADDAVAEKERLLDTAKDDQSKARTAMGAAKSEEAKLLAFISELISELVAKAIDRHEATIARLENAVVVLNSATEPDG